LVTQSKRLEQKVSARRVGRSEGGTGPDDGSHRRRVPTGDADVNDSSRTQYGPGVANRRGYRQRFFAKRNIGEAQVDCLITNTESPELIMVSVDDIAKRAYEMYLERGRTDGFDREDWRRAESELKAPAHYSYTSGPATVAAR
jgi:Protein of unknown function (DUF2934)